MKKIIMLFCACLSSAVTAYDSLSQVLPGIPVSRPVQHHLSRRVSRHVCTTGCRPWVWMWCGVALSMLRVPKIKSLGFLF